MYERLLDFFLTEPGRLIGLGRGLVNTGGLILVIGTIGRLATTAVGAIKGIGKHQAIERTLADLYPSLPTWWVPESIIGCLPAILLVGLGLSAVHFGKRLQSVYF